MDSSRRCVYPILKELENRCFRNFRNIEFQNIILKTTNNSSLLSSHNITNRENELEYLEFVVEGILIPVFTSLGLVGNILSIIVLHSPGVDMKVNNIISLQNITKIRTP